MWNAKSANSGIGGAPDTEKAKSTGLTHQKASFNKFYLKYLGPAVNAGKIAAAAVLNALTKAPFNFSFGLYLVNDY